MGVVANAPIAMAAGLGINGAVAFGLVLTQGLTLAGAMGVIVLEGLVVLVLVLVGLREAIMRAVPLALKRAIGVGIGLFILFIGFIDAGLIVKPEGRRPRTRSGTFVFPTTTGAVRVLVRPAAHGRPVGPQDPGRAAAEHPHHDHRRRSSLGVTAIPDDLTATPNFSNILQFDLTNVFTVLGGLAAILTIFSFMLTDFFDTMGTATAISEQAGLVDEEGQPRTSGASCWSTRSARPLGGAAGISSNTSYIESAAGVGRGWPDRLHLGRDRRALPGRHPAGAAGRARAVRRDRRRSSSSSGSCMVEPDQGHRLHRPRGRLSRPCSRIILMPLTFSITVGIGAGVRRVRLHQDRPRQAHARSIRSCGASAIAFLVYFLQDWIRTTIAGRAGGRTCPAGSTPVRRRAAAAGTRPAAPALPVPSVAMFERTALPEGPRVISSRLAGARSVSIAAYVLAGSRLETPDEAGVAHFMEHITFKGTAAYPSTRAISEAIEGVGGSFNAATDRESTVYWVRVPRREAPARMDVLGELIVRPILSTDRDRRRALGHHRGDPLLPGRPGRVRPDAVPDRALRRRAAGPRDLRRRGRHPGPARPTPSATFWRTTVPAGQHGRRRRRRPRPRRRP